MTEQTMPHILSLNLAEGLSTLKRACDLLALGHDPSLGLGTLDGKVGSGRNEPSLTLLEKGPSLANQMNQVLPAAVGSSFAVGAPL